MADHLLGRVLGRYRIVERIGAGGMGTVYRATDETLRRTVAIKVLADDVAENAETRGRFLREARLAASLTHPCVAAVYDAGESDDGHVYIAMELVPGKSLRQRLVGGALDVPTAVHVAKEITRALVAAHGLGIVHRDLKPDNVMLGEDRSVKVLDFGLAKTTSSSEDGPAPSSFVTQADRVLGTPGYMAPEQAAGRTVDARADLFSVGVVLYEMLTGERPFRGSSAIDVLVSTARDEPRVPAGIGAALVRVVLRCLEKSPEARYADAGALLRALEAVDVRIARASKSRKRPRWVIALAGAAIVSASVLAGGALSTFVLEKTTLRPTTPTRPPTASTSTLEPDAGSRSLLGSARNAFSFSPSNLGSFLTTVDATKLVDIDVSTPGELSVACVALPDHGCVSGTVEQSDGSGAVVYVARSWKIEPSGLLAVKETEPVIVVALETIRILGRLDASASGQRATAGGFSPTRPGPGVGGAAVSGDRVSYGIGAGGGAFCGAGGAGGLANTTNGFGGATYGTATLVPLVGGSAGGAGDLVAGAGGGAIELVAGTSIVVGPIGVVSVGGGGGSAGDTIHGSAGGGSGGALLVEAPAVTIDGTLAANGGGGGGGSGAGMGADAHASRIAAPGGFSGTSGAGGSGSAASTTAGSAGATGDPSGGKNAPGGGGGGSGWVRINTERGEATLGGVLSPAKGSACLTQGTLPL
ncbi:MAG: serine/threonine-protein kinase [Polyangiaceae bacterium]